jgi:serine/threonine-protein kinase
MAEKKGRILCVDNEPNILRSLTWLLQKEFDVMTANSGHDGLALVSQNDFDVIISDQRMPGMMGSEFLHEVRKASPRSIRILLTGYSDLQAIIRSVNDSEVFRFINKPWKIDELPGIIAEAALLSKTHPCTEASTDSTAAISSPSQHAFENLLIIDDETTIALHLKQELGETLNIIHAQNIADAVVSFSEHDIGLILADTRVGNTDTTALLRMLKQQQPEIVTVVYTTETDAADVIGLINQGQIFRFIPKPVKLPILALAITSAARKRQQLKNNPELAKRYAVQDVGQETKLALNESISQAAQNAQKSSTDHSILHRIGGGLKRLFGGH